MKHEKIVLIGGGGHCKACIDVIELEGKYKIAGIVDVAEKVGQNVLGYQIIGTDDDTENLSKQYSNLLITVGQIKSPRLRMSLFSQLKILDAIFPVIVSPRSYISKYAEVGQGTIVMHDAVINAGTKIGENCIINNKALVEHDAVIGDNCHIATGAIVNGGVHIGSGTFFGSGAVSKEYISIPENSFIKANALVK